MAKARVTLAGICPKTFGRQRQFLPLKSAAHSKGSLCLAFAKIQEEVGPQGYGKKIPQKVCHHRVQKVQELQEPPSCQRLCS